MSRTYPLVHAAIVVLLFVGAAAVRALQIRDPPFLTGYILAGLGIALVLYIHADMTRHGEAVGAYQLIVQVCGAFTALVYVEIMRVLLSTRRSLPAARVLRR